MGLRLAHLGAQTGNVEPATVRTTTMLLDNPALNPKAYWKSESLLRTPRGLAFIGLMCKGVGVLDSGSFSGVRAFSEFWECFRNVAGLL